MASGFQRLAVALAAVATTVGCGGAPGLAQEATIIPAVSAVDVDQTVDLAVTVAGFTQGYPVQLSWCVVRDGPGAACCWCPTDATSPCDLTPDVCTDGYLKGPLDRRTATFVPPRRAGTFRARVVGNVWGTSETATATAVITVGNPAP